MIDYELAQELISKLEAFNEHASEKYLLEKPLSDFVYQNQFDNLLAVNRLAEDILAARAETTDQLEIKPSVNAQYLIDQIKPWVEQIRLKLFNTKSAPFNSHDDAQTWLNEAEEEVECLSKRVEDWHKRVNGWRAIKDKWQALFKDMNENYPLLKEGIKKWSALSKQGVLVSLPSRQEFEELDSLARQAERIDPGEPPEETERIKAWRTLVDEILKINQVTGFTIKSIEMFILADVLPVLPPYTLNIINRTDSVSTGTSIQNRFAIVTIRGDLTFEGLRSVYRRIRRELGIKRSKRSTTKHLQLYQMVQQRGGIPSGKGKVAFWESLRLDWNRQHQKPYYSTWKGIKIAYDRLHKKMRDRYQAKI